MECRAYAQEINEVEHLLLPAMKQHWNLRPAPLSVDTLIQRNHPGWPTNILLVTRTALISIFFLAFVLSAWQFTRSGSHTSTPVSSNVLPIPTPSSQSTSTTISLVNCKGFLYQLQKNDTLGRIADQFSVSREKIMAINHLNTETLGTRTQLWIPLCPSTPTGTIYPSTLTITFTPLLGAITSTPGG